MPRERLQPNDPREWLNRARSNLIQAQVDQRGVYLEDLCFQAQQAVEKALKGVLLYRQAKYPYTHDIGQLIHLLESGGEPVPPSVREAAQLTPYAVQARYPGLSEPVGPEEYAEAVSLAEAAVGWAESVLGR